MSATVPPVSAPPRATARGWYSGRQQNDAIAMPVLLAP
jgi:hypothetical protein